MTVPWHVNEGLAPLIAEVRAMYPGIVIGTIGDASHQQQGSQSDHNPNAAGRVNAADFMLGAAFTEDDALALLPFLIADPRSKYVIHDRRIWEDPVGHPASEAGWHDYTGSDPHTNHIHLSVWDSAHTSTGPWNITPRKVSWMDFTVSLPVLKEGDNDNMFPDTYHRISRIQKIVGVSVDGDWGPETTGGIASWCGVTTDQARTMTETLWRNILGLS